MIDLYTFLQDIVDRLIEVDGLQAIVLGGSWAKDQYTPKFDLHALSPKSL